MDRALTILVAEDDPNDALLLKLAFDRVWVNAWVHFVSDGQEAIDYLQGEPRYEDRARYPWPDLLMLDLKMPRANGFDVLGWLHQRPGLNRMVVAVLSGCAWQPDIDRAYALGANFYFIKSLHFEDLVGMAESLKDETLEALRLDALVGFIPRSGGGQVGLRSACPKQQAAIVGCQRS